MSVVIIGGHERMEYRYQKICEEYGCTAKVYTKEKGAMKKKNWFTGFINLFYHYSIT